MPQVLDFFEEHATAFLPAATMATILEVIIVIIVTVAIIVIIEVMVVLKQAILSQDGPWSPHIKMLHESSFHHLTFIWCPQRLPSFRETPACGSFST